LWPAFREDYFAVPDILARKKEIAEFFAKRWGRLVGPVQLVYARTPEGRRMLLRARVHSVAGALQKRSERVSCWKGPAARLARVWSSPSFAKPVSSRPRRSRDPCHSV